MPGFRIEPNPADMPGQGMGQSTGDYGGGEDSRSNEEMINDLVRQYLAGGPADTAEQEALIRQQIEQDLAMSLRDQRASAGASGFEASGALIGAEGDTRRRANMDATDQILGARSKAEEDAFERAMTAAGLDQEERAMAIDERMRQLQLDALNAWIESQGGDPAGGPIGATGPTGSTDNRTREQVAQDENEVNAARDAYTGGPEAYDAAQAEGYAAVVRYSMENGGDFSGLPVRSPGPGDVLAHGVGDNNVWYNPETGELFQGGG
jgi:hypothetical protein